MSDEEKSSDIEWSQKKKPEDNARFGRKLDLRKTLEAEAKDRNNFRAEKKKAKLVSPNLRRLKTKINNWYDDDDEDEDEVVFFFGPEDNNMSLLGALKDDEKVVFENKQILENQKMQQAAEKLDATLRADAASKALGIKGLSKKVISEKTMNISIGRNDFEETLKQNISSNTKIKTSNLSAKDSKNLVKGLQKISQNTSTKDSATLINSVEADDLIEIGRSKNDKETAKLILEKSGRKAPKVSKAKEKEDKIAKKKAKSFDKSFKAR